MPFVYAMLELIDFLINYCDTLIVAVEENSSEDEFVGNISASSICLVR